MNPRERGFLLLTSRLGDPNRRCLTTAQLRGLWNRMSSMPRPEEDRELEEGDLLRLGYGREFAARIVSLLNQDVLLERYLIRGAQRDCSALTMVSESYPEILRRRLGHDTPGCLWMKGDPSILALPGISLVGSREPREENSSFAAQVGQQAARHGLVLISGNARGADRIAQESCLDAGGKVISLVADELYKCPLRRNVLYLSEEGFDEPFTIPRALSRNRCIHTLGQMVFVAQAELKKGGSWNGSVQNLRQGWSPVACFRDGSQAARELEELGAFPVDASDLMDLPFFTASQGCSWQD